MNCTHSGCTGTITDGFCDECGRAPAGQSLLKTFNQPNVMTGRTGTVSTGRATSRKQTSRSTKGSSSRRKALGGGLVSLPPQPSQDPLSLIMANPEVPERKRRCPGCEHKVSREKGFCPNCGQEYNFIPSLKAGDMLNGKFEIKGPISFGGLGWIYLAWDTLLARWVILKGLLNTKDPSAAAAAVAERQFLAAVKHPKIVGIYDFVNRGPEGFIVMEYVGGKTWDSILKEKKVMPVEEAIAYTLGILPAFGYLHQQQMVYCDFKPGNAMLEDDDVKLIDMGGVRKIGDPNGDIYGTIGYMAPEAANDPVEVSDLYTIGRTLAVMIMDFKYQSKEYEHKIPTPDEQPILEKYDALYRFLLRATHDDPDQRFQSADEMHDQLFGVLREIVALNEGPKPTESKVFTSDNLINGEDREGASHPLLRLLPTIKVDTNDIAASELVSLSGIIDNERYIDALNRLRDKTRMANSSEAKFRLVDALIMKDAEKHKRKINNLLDTAEKNDPFDWRIFWYKGKYAFGTEQWRLAWECFDKCYFEMPGELAPKLAMAFVAEARKEIGVAKALYNRIATVDPSQTSACFGLARCCAATRDFEGAPEALKRIPPSHSMFTLSKILLAELLLSEENTITDQLLEEAHLTIASINVEGGILHQLGAKLLSSALNLIDRGVCKEDSSKNLLGHPMQIRKLRRGAEEEYRKTARFAPTPEIAMFWIDTANRIRPFTLF